MLEHELGRPVHICPEPVEQWEASGLLKDSYVSPERYLFPAQCNFFSTRIDAICRAIAEAPPGALIISERSPFSDKMFATLDNRLEPRLQGIYLDLWSHFQRLLPIAQPHGFLYLRPSSIDTCMERLHERARASETSIQRDYQVALRARHDAELGKGEAVMPNGAVVPVLLLNGDENFRDSREHAQVLASQIAQFVGRLIN
jgi:deoxyadenosine/deoxycytidine kinase